MTRYCLIRDGKVFEVFEAEPALHPSLALVPTDDEGVTAGWSYDGETFAPPSPKPLPAPPVPEAISDRQFFQQLAVDGDISQDDALAAVQTGTLPKKLSNAIGELPASQQFSAKMLVCGATEFHRSNPMVPVLGQALGKDAVALDALWSAASAL